MTDHLLETFEDGVSTLTMNRPASLNALSSEMMAAMEEALPRLAEDPATRCVVLTGAGGAFCAGGDVKGFAASAEQSAAAPARSPADRAAGLRRGMEVSRILHTMPKPTLAVMPGAAAGAGLSMALACDMRLALDTARITTAFANIGLSGDYGGSWFLPALVGAAKARELYMLGDVISGREAEAIGLVNRACPAGELAEAARTLARRLADRPPLAMGMIKKNLNAAMGGTLEEVFDLEAEHMTRCFDTEDHKNAAKAFAAKEPMPVFHGC